MAFSKSIKERQVVASEIERLYACTPKLIDDISEPCIIFFIHNTYSLTLSEQELYDCTRQFWKKVAKKEREEILHRTALAVVEGVIVSVYEIESWHLAGSTPSSRKYEGTPEDNKWEFVGHVLKNHPLTENKLVESTGETIKALENGYTYIPRRD